jgi:hypothetical protein
VRRVGPRNPTIARYIFWMARTTQLVSSGYPSTVPTIPADSPPSASCARRRGAGVAGACVLAAVVVVVDFDADDHDTDPSDDICVSPPSRKANQGHPLFRGLLKNSHRSEAARRKPGGVVNRSLLVGADRPAVHGQIQLSGKSTSSSLSKRPIDLDRAGQRSPNCVTTRPYLHFDRAWIGEGTSEKFGSPEQYLP